MIRILGYSIGGTLGFYLLLGIAVYIASRIRAARGPIDEPTLADDIRERRRAWLRKAFPGVLPEDQEWSVPGSWYLGGPCSICGEMIPILSEATGGR